MPTTRTPHLDLNQPFEFQEALLSTAERSRLVKASTAHQLFEGEPARTEIKEFRLRAISIRLRTINNACDAGASLPDGTPLTGVSIYGSLGRHYVLGPYSAVRRLMSGVLPDHSPHIISDAIGRRALGHLDDAQRVLAGYIGQVEKGNRVMKIYLNSLVPPGAVAGPFGRMVQVAKEDLPFLREAFNRLGMLKLEIPKAPEPPVAPTHWWEEMPHFIGRDEYERLTVGVINQARQVLYELEDKVFAPG